LAMRRFAPVEKIALGFERGGFFTEPLPVEVFTKKDFSDERREMARTGKSAWLRPEPIRGRGGNGQRIGQGGGGLGNGGSGRGKG